MMDGMSEKGNQIENKGPDLGAASQSRRVGTGPFSSHPGWLSLPFLSSFVRWDAA